MKLTLHLLLLFFICACQSPKVDAVSVEATPMDNEIDLMEIVPLELAEHQDVTIERDTYFNQTKHYSAISLNYILNKYLALHQIDTSEAILIFECVDGYKPTMPLSLVTDNQGFIAISDKEAVQGAAWTDEVKDKFTPYYLVWLEDKKELATPYGLYKIALSYASAQYADAMPEQDTALLAGFELFKSNCMKCHSINKVGGSLGPELNYPKNITAYWAKEDIWQFIQAPQSYRYNSKMPPMDKLARADFEVIMSYISHMENKKMN